MAGMSLSGAYDSTKINSLVQLAVSSETSKVESLQTEKSRLDRTSTVTASLESSVSALRTAVRALTAAGALETKKASVSNADILSASADYSASAGTYSIQVTSLAQKHRLGSSSLSDAGTSLITAEGAGARTFRIAAGTSTEDITVDLAEGDTDSAVLNKILEAVSSQSKLAKGGVIKETSAGSTLVLEAADSGLAGKLTLTDVTGTLLKSAGVLAADGGAARELQAASDASFKIGDSLTVTRSTNEIADAVTGVVFTLKELGSATLAVSADADAVAAKFTAFVNAYNAAQTAVGTQLNEATDPDDPSKGVLYANSQLRALRNGLRLRLGELRTGALASLAQTGFGSVDAKAVTAAQSYNITLDASALKEALVSDPAAFKELACGTDGIFTLLNSDLDFHLGTNGTFNSLENSLDSRVTNVANRIKAAQKLLDSRTAYYTGLYTSLAGQITTMQNQSQAINSIYGSVYGTASASSSGTSY